MTDADLDRAYTTLCEAMSSVGEKAALQLLSNFALLAILEIDDASRIDTLVERATAAMRTGPAPPSHE